MRCVRHAFVIEGAARIHKEVVLKTPWRSLCAVDRVSRRTIQSTVNSSRRTRIIDRRHVRSQNTHISPLFSLRASSQSYRSQHSSSCGPRLVLSTENNNTSISIPSSSSLPSSSASTSPMHRPRSSVFIDPEDLNMVLGSPARSRSVWRSIKSGRDPRTDETHVAPRVRARLACLLPHETSRDPMLSRAVHANDGTVKLLIRLHDGAHIETVIIPHFKQRSTAADVHNSGARSTLCVSTQVGCNRGCTFCATGAMGLIRNLTAEEIAAQLYLATQFVSHSAAAAALPEISRVVLMGMGDALCNAREVRRALETFIVSPRAFGMSHFSVTLSSVAPTTSSIRAAGSMPAMLAWSLHAARDDTRRAIVPSSPRTQSVVALRDAFGEALSSRASSRARVFRVSATLLRDVNDSEQDAEAMANLLTPLRDRHGVRVCVDLIQYNTVELPQFAHLQKTTHARRDRFQAAIRRAGLVCFVRNPRGDDANAACGQLVTL